MKDNKKVIFIGWTDLINGIYPGAKSKVVNIEIKSNEKSETKQYFITPMLPGAVDMLKTLSQHYQIIILNSSNNEIQYLCNAELLKQHGITAGLINEDLSFDSEKEVIFAKIQPHSGSTFEKYLNDNSIDFQNTDGKKCNYIQYFREKTASEIIAFIDRDDKETIAANEKNINFIYLYLNDNLANSEIIYKEKILGKLDINNKIAINKKINECKEQLNDYINSSKLKFNKKPSLMFIANLQEQFNNGQLESYQLVSRLNIYLQKNNYKEGKINANTYIYNLLQDIMNINHKEKTYSEVKNALNQLNNEIVFKNQESSHNRLQFFNNNNEVDNEIIIYDSHQKNHKKIIFIDWDDTLSAFYHNGPEAIVTINGHEHEIAPMLPGAINLLKILSKHYQVVILSNVNDSANALKRIQLLEQHELKAGLINEDLSFDKEHDVVFVIETESYQTYLKEQLALEQNSDENQNIIIQISDKLPTNCKWRYMQYFAKNTNSQIIGYLDDAVEEIQNAIKDGINSIQVTIKNSLIINGLPTCAGSETFYYEVVLAQFQETRNDIDYIQYHEKLIDGKKTFVTRQLLDDALDSLKKLQHPNVTKATTMFKKLSIHQQVISAIETLRDQYNSQKIDNIKLSELLTGYVNQIKPLSKSKNGKLTAEIIYNLADSLCDGLFNMSSNNNLQYVEANKRSM